MQVPSWIRGKSFERFFTYLKHCISDAVLFIGVRLKVDNSTIKNY